VVAASPKKINSVEEVEDSDTVDSLEVVFKLFNERYIDLVKVLPPLPKKGEFDVSSIKRSRYFFS
jgi:DNA-directed RNA polymerase